MTHVGSFVCQVCIGFCDIMWINGQTLVKALLLVTAVDIENYDISTTIYRVKKL